MPTKLLQGLSKFYWSPNLPETYTIARPDTGVIVGIGLVAYKDYAAFSLAWAKCRGQWKTLPDQRKLVEAFTGYSAITPISMESATVGDLVCLLSPAKFAATVAADKLLSDYLKLDLTNVAQQAIGMQETQ